MKKEYSQEEIRAYYRNDICPECRGKLFRNGTKDNTWTLLSRCRRYGSDFEFVKVSTGQELPSLIKDTVDFKEPPTWDI